MRSFDRSYSALLPFLMAFVLLWLQVNNATARVVTKKPQTPLVNGDISSKTLHWIPSDLCLHLRNKNWLIWHFLSAIASGWKINPVMGAMYAPELYTGNSDHCYAITSILPLHYHYHFYHSINLIFLFFLWVFSGQFPIPCSNSYLGVPGIYAAWPRQSRLQHNSLYCSRTCCCARLPGVRLCPCASTWSTITAESLINLFILFELLLLGWFIRMDCMEQRSM